MGGGWGQDLKGVRVWEGVRGFRRGLGYGRGLGILEWGLGSHRGQGILERVGVQEGLGTLGGELGRPLSFANFICQFEVVRIEIETCFFVNSLDFFCPFILCSLFCSKCNSFQLTMLYQP